jgi:Rrf2 family transcriptional regulator, cysteine metabolism repressor
MGSSIMRVSTKGRYGLRALVDLAFNSSGEHISLNSIAERQEISVNYLEQVFSLLRKAGIVNSVKGAQGGYVLSQEPSRIGVGMILRVLEGSLSVIDENPSAADMEDDIQSSIRKVLWERIDDKVNELIAGITLEDLVIEYRRKVGSSAPMYNI